MLEDDDVELQGSLEDRQATDAMERAARQLRARGREGVAQPPRAHEPEPLVR